MNNKFSDYTNSKIGERKAEKIIKEKAEEKVNEFKNTNPKDYENIDNLVNQYSNFSENDLLKEFFKMAQEKKQNGTLTQNDIQNMKNTIYPMLTTQQKNSFDNLMNVLK